MKIAIAGFAGSGKTTVGKRLAKELNFNLISPSFKDLAKKEGITLEEFQKKAEKNKVIDITFDKYVLDETKKGNCIITTWLGPWIVDADLRIWLYAPFKVRAKRISERDKISILQAEKSIRTREMQNKKRYLALYKIDITDTNIFDVAFNSARFSPREIVGIIIQIMKIKR